MKSPICEMLDIEFPLVAFSHCRDVVVAVSKAGGCGVLGAVGMSPEQLEKELKWIDDHIDGKPYGVDVLIPNKMVGKDEKFNPEKLAKMIPQEYADFRTDVLENHGIEAPELREIDTAGSGFAENTQSDGAKALLDVAFNHPIKIIANALGVPPDWMIEMGKKNNCKVAALLGTAQHAINQVKAGVDILVVSGTEAGGHCGSVSTMVLIPEVHEAIQPYGDVPILAAGGIVTGKQMAAAMAMGASGAWCGSVWLTTIESEVEPVIKEKMVAANSSQTVRSRSRTGKHSRQLVTPWTEAWESESAPEPLPMPLQPMVAEPALQKVNKLAAGGHEGAKDLATYWVGQGVGLMNQSISASDVVQEFKEDFVNAYERLNNFLS
ncbi:MAG: nitronate monooxygenase [Pseudomonadota bacterium]|mgnify:FL=1|jgi:NAD(P)H-dependent flavin oxidoreductase YrpB (nitropropane dioxygenase family)|nr:nitronate monooxygenase [Pseudomonadota bacterium]MEC7787382.1 nitronate monooxygenase [Pseudomonadota bacterium]MEC8377876.1 nitronate monooxygenase [Pseudomonadota bacterium]MEC9193358.1 nitronate monooxygenase [Pseudomonadota bacterium]|tara:strand:- start:1373 stop:2509 length:1137 start_codon:yes stop_codon:yes gene_type:complete